MWKAAAIVGAVEVVAYSVWAIVSMVRAGQGSGVWIPMLPLFWLILAFRLWTVLRAADMVVDVGSWQFVFVASAFGFVFSLLALVLLGSGSSGWEFYKWILCPAAAHLFAAVLAVVAPPVTKHTDDRACDER